MIELPVHGIISGAFVLECLYIIMQAWMHIVRGPQALPSVFLIKLFPR